MCPKQKTQFSYTILISDRLLIYSIILHSTNGESQPRGVGFHVVFCSKICPRMFSVNKECRYSLVLCRGLIKALDIEILIKPLDSHLISPSVNPQILIFQSQQLVRLFPLHPLSQPPSTNNHMFFLPAIHTTKSLCHTSSGLTSNDKKPLFLH